MTPSSIPNAFSLEYLPFNRLNEMINKTNMPAIRCNICNRTKTYMKEVVIELCAPVK